MYLILSYTVEKWPTLSSAFSASLSDSLSSYVSFVARKASAPTERLDAVRKLAASLHCPLLFAEDQVCANVCHR